MNELLADLREALRQLRRAPRFTLLACSLLGLGLGSTIAIYSLFHSIVLAPLPYAAPGELVVFRSLNHVKAIDQEAVSPADFRDLAEQTRSLSATGAVRPNFIAYTPTNGAPRQLVTGLVTRGLFDVFGVAPLQGRTFAADEFSVTSNPTVVLSEPAWEKYFGRSPEIIGRTIPLDDVPHTIIGIMPASFREPTFVDVWLPFPDESGEYFARDARFWSAFGRLASGQSERSAAAEIETLAADLAREHPDTNRDWSTILVSLQEQRTTGIRTSLVLLLGAVGLVLLIVCGNLANLLLARSLARFPELGVRLALGTTPRRLARVVVAESLGLALAGGLLGILLASFLLPIVAEQIPPVLLPRAHEVVLQPAAIIVGLGAAVLCALLCSALPAWHLARADVNQWLKDGASRGSTGGGLGRWQGPLVAGQFALTVAVVAAALLLMQSLVRLNQVPPGFNPEQVLTLQLSPPTTRYETNAELHRYYEDIMRVAAEIPGVASTAINASPPLSGITLTFPSWPHGVSRDAENAVDSVYAPVTEDYFRTLQIPLRRGREFTRFDNADRAPVAIINETYARQVFPGQNPIGQRVLMIPWMGTGYHEIVGVVGDTRQTLLTEPPPPQVYVPATQMPWFFTTLLIKLEQPAAAMSVVAALRRHDPTLPLSPTALTANIAQGSTQARLYAWLFSGFAALALGLSALGLYASLRFSLAQRTREIGVRIALGATPATIRRHVLLQAARLTGSGLIAGLFIGLPATTLLRSRLHGIESSDPLTYLGLIALLAVITTFTALPLAHRASRTNPANLLQDS